MKLKTIVLVAAFAVTGPFAFAQAPIGSSATSGNGAVINRGPVDTVGEDLDFRTNRAYAPPMTRHYRYRHARRWHSGYWR